MTIYVLAVGVPGCGKSTLFRKVSKRWCELQRHSQQQVPIFRVSQDELGASRFLKNLSLAPPRSIVLVDKNHHTQQLRHRTLSHCVPNSAIVYVAWDVMPWSMNKRALCLNRIRKRLAHPTLPPEYASRVLKGFISSFEPLTSDEIEKAHAVVSIPVASHNGGRQAADRTMKELFESLSGW
eukprot:PhM_4_TR15314/c0_g1_i1/m.26331